jgi:hypothetical protein
MPDHVKMMAVEKMMAMVGCGQAPAPSQTMLCMDMGAGMVRCRTN